MALKAIKDGRISGYPEYTSTALGSFFHVPASKIPSNAIPAYNEAKADFAKEGIVAFPPTPFADSNAVGTLDDDGSQAWPEGHLGSDRQVAESRSRRFP